MAAGSVRVHEIAKKLGIPSKDAILALKEKLGVEVKSHSSTISQDDADKLESMLSNKEPEKKEVTAQVEKPASKAEEPKPEQPRKPRPKFFSVRAKQETSLKKFKEYQTPEMKQAALQAQQRAQAKAEAEKAQAAKPEPPKPPVKPVITQSTPKTPLPTKPVVAEPPKVPVNQQPQKPVQQPVKQEAVKKPEPPKKPEIAKRVEKPAVVKPAPSQPGEPQFAQPRKPDSQKFQQKQVPKHKEKLKSKQEIEEEKLLAKIAAKKKEEEKKQEEEEKVKEVSIEEQLTVGELAEKLGVSVAVVVKELMMSGVMATVNQTIDVVTAKKTAEALEFTIIEPEKEAPNGEEEEEKESTSIKPKEEEGVKLVERAPVVTIMGHVDHGKTTLLDAIRKSRHKIVTTEAGGITQSIGAYTAEVNDKNIVFIDTPGHSAFTAMRARGARVTDIVILVVAADDGIMPQTIEAINHAKAAKVPIIIAVNKIDKENADPDRVLQQLTEHQLVPEKWGGDTITVELSALQGINLEELLEYILLVAEMEELKANPDRKATGVVIESKLDKGKGAVATFLVQTGTLRVGDHVVSGISGGRVRALINDSGERVKEAGPSTPIEILGLTELPDAGDVFDAVSCDKEMKDIIAKRKDELKTSKLEVMAPTNVKREALLKKVEGEIKELNIIIKASTHGSAEAVSASLAQLESKKIFVKVVHLGVGDISEADIMLASASEAIVIGFGVKEDANALRVAADEGVLIQKYDIIYKLLEDIEETMLGLLEPEYKEVESGRAEVRQVFTVGKNVKIAGCYVLEGKIVRNKDAVVVRDGNEIFKGPLSQLKRFKDDVKEVATGYECGISFDKFNDIEEGDQIVVYTKEEIKRHTLV